MKKLVLVLTLIVMLSGCAELMRQQRREALQKDFETSGNPEIIVEVYNLFLEDDDKTLLAALLQKVDTKAKEGDINSARWLANNIGIMMSIDPTVTQDTYIELLAKFKDPKALLTIGQKYSKNGSSKKAEAMFQEAIKAGDLEGYVYLCSELFKVQFIRSRDYHTKLDFTETAACARDCLKATIDGKKAKLAEHCIGYLDKVQDAMPESEKKEWRNKAAEL